MPTDAQYAAALDAYYARRGRAAKPPGLGADGSVVVDGAVIRVGLKLYNLAHGRVALSAGPLLRERLRAWELVRTDDDGTERVVSLGEWWDEKYAAALDIHYARHGGAAKPPGEGADGTVTVDGMRVNIGVKLFNLAHRRAHLSGMPLLRERLRARGLLCRDDDGTERVVSMTEWWDEKYAAALEAYYAQHGWAAKPPGVGASGRVLVDGIEIHIGLKLYNVTHGRARLSELPLLEKRLLAHGLLHTAF